MAGPYNINNPDTIFQHKHPIATTSAQGDMSSADKIKLDGIAPGATVNDTNAELRDRTTHTGEQGISTITNLQTVLDGKQAIITQSASAPNSPSVGDLWIDLS